MNEANKKLRVAVVGSGPAGMYATAHLFGSPTGTWVDGRMAHLLDHPVSVDVFDRLPTPWGLVRGGVAPDHPDRKRIADVFERVTRHPDFRFFGNVAIGDGLAVNDLAEHYHAVIFAHGCEGARRLGIPGENLAGCSAARDFVAWYNGHPDAAELNFDLSGERAVIIGNGNVAMDAARLLLRDPQDLATTDIADPALEALRQNNIREVVIVARRGPAHAAWSPAELDEIAALDGVEVAVDPAALSSEPGDPSNARLAQLKRIASHPDPSARKRLVLRFNARPREIHGSEKVASIRFESTNGSDEFSLDAGLVLSAIGYRGRAIEGLPFDDATGTVPSDAGRVAMTESTAAGCYVTGWARRGASGVIGSNRKCARDAVRALADDLENGRLELRKLPGREEIVRRVAARRPDHVTQAGWQAIDSVEREAGQAAGRPRVKITTTAGLLNIAMQTSSGHPQHPRGGERRYDAIIVGSGLGGLSTAACLAAAGKSVLVVEQHELTGGCSQTFRRKGKWEFDCGVHYVGGCVPGSDGLIPTVFRGLGFEDRIQWSRMDDSGMDTVHFPDHQFRIPTSWDGYAENLRQCFPADADGLTRCIKELQHIGEGADRINDVPHSLGAIVPLLKRPLEAFAIARGLEQPIGRLFDRCGLSQQARAAILSQVHLHNTPPAKTPALLVAVLLRHYFKAGAYFPYGGGQVIAGNLTEVILAHGGTVRTLTRVQSIDVDAGRVRGVTLTDGERIRADIVVSNADVHRTFQNLIAPEHLSARLKKRIANYRRPHSIFSMYLGADIDLAKTRPATNFLLHDRYDVQTTYDLLDRGEWDPKGWIAISSPTLKTWGQRHYGPADHSAIELFCAVPGEYEFWGGQSPLKGSAYKWSQAYQDRKAEVEGVLLERTLRALPELRGHVAWQEAASPLTHERFTLTRMPYGPENAKDQIGPFRRLPVTTEIKGLYLAGASTAYMYGIAFTLRGGVGTASHILGRDLMKAFHAGEVLADRKALPAHAPDWDPFQASRGHSRPAAEPRQANAGLAAA